ncbi:MAG: ribosome small subunit-dependent GTPase A [Bacillota bacterium]
MINGIIIKGIGGFYYVQTENGIYECKARGKFRKENRTPLVGDRVKISIYDLSNQGVIEDILCRDTELIRPPVANVNQAVIVFAIQQPDPNLSLLDRFLVLAESEKIDIAICFNKIELGIPKHMEDIMEDYCKAGYTVVTTSAKKEIGLDDLSSFLKNKISVFAGPSGVGKSSLLNAIQPNLRLKTGEISQKIERGKHTTRHVELLRLTFGGWVLDTPGFSTLNIDFITEDELQYLFKEFIPLFEKCKYTGCRHISEPYCGIKDGVAEGLISQSRYNSYIQFIEEIRQSRRY